MQPTNRISDNSGDHDSKLRQFTQFCRDYETSIFNYILNMVRVHDAAQDITQETLLQAYRAWDKFVVGGLIVDNPVKESYRIATHLAIAYLRKKGPDPTR
jgi:RNA polymerase sigma-70 factor (ECF subfamily)